MLHAIQSHNLHPWDVLRRLKLVTYGLLLALASLALTGCTAFLNLEPTTWTDSPTHILSGLQPGETAGQTFTSHFAGLNSITLWIQPDHASGNLENGAIYTGALKLHIYSSPTNLEEWASSMLPIEQLTVDGAYHFTFPSIPTSSNQDFYLLLENQSSIPILIGQRPGETYLDGAAYWQGKPINSQLTFSLAYAPVQASLGLLREAITWLWLFLAAIFLLLPPGWALLELFYPQIQERAKLQPDIERILLALGVGLSVYPLLYLWCFAPRLVGLPVLRLGPLYAWLPPLTSLAYLAWHHLSTHKELQKIAVPWNASTSSTCLESKNGRRATAKPESAAVHFQPQFVLIILLGMVLFTRFYVLRSIDIPLWGDSYQHTLITQLILENGGLFQSWQPYASLEIFTYHFGFHSLAATFSWLTGLSASQAILWFGQFLNCLAIALLAPLARKVGRSPWASIWCILIAALISPMPMGYINWGRYTQLAGLVMLPVVVFLLWEHLSLSVSARHWKTDLLAGIAWSGLAATHYRLLLFAAIFPILFLIDRSHHRRSQLRSIAQVGGAATLLSLPWIVQIATRARLVQTVAYLLHTPSSQMPNFVQEHHTFGDLTLYQPLGLWLLLPAILAFLLWGNRKNALQIILWWYLLLLLANPDWFNLPGAGIFSNFAVLISLYIPFGLLFGAAASFLAHKMKPYFPTANRLAFPLALLILLIAAVYGIPRQFQIVDLQKSSLVTHPDLRAAAWIRANTSQNARFLVNSFFAYGDTVLAGSDAGWWLPLLAQRQTTLPPLNFALEQKPPGYVNWEYHLADKLAKSGDIFLRDSSTPASSPSSEHLETVDPATLALLRQYGITHVYIGQRQGKVNNSHTILDYTQLLASPAFSLVYHQDRVWIFELKTQGITQ